MSALSLKSSSELAAALTEALGWTLLHSLWQGLLVAGALWLALEGLDRRRARLRHAAAALALTAAPLCSLVTFLLLWTGPGRAGARGSAAAASAPAWLLGAAGALVPFIPWLVLGWAIAVAVASTRLGREYLALRRVYRAPRGRVGAELERVGERLRVAFRLASPVPLAITRALDVPAVVGILRPVILIPASCVTGLTGAQIEAILAHEFAHVARRDALVNLIQSAVEVLYVHHPAVRWISDALRDERECCCDDLAVRVVGDPLDYALALTELETLRVPPVPLALAAGVTGPVPNPNHGPRHAPRGSLMSRIHRLIPASASRTKPAHSTRARRPAAVAWPLPLLLACGLCTLALAPACDAEPDDVIERQAEEACEDGHVVIDALSPAGVEVDGEVLKWTTKDGETVELPVGADVFVLKEGDEEEGEGDNHVVALQVLKQAGGEQPSAAVQEKLRALHELHERRGAHEGGEAQAKFMAFVDEGGELHELDGPGAELIELKSLDDLDALDIDAEKLAKIKAIAAAASAGAPEGNVWIQHEDEHEHGEHGEHAGVHGVFVMKQTDEDDS